MELKVWVEGVARVVCGVSLTTSCQDVVVALAQATGQTGRYHFVLKRCAAERHLVADDCPLQLLARLGQSLTDVCFFLRRVGSGLAGGAAGQELLHRPWSAQPLLLELLEPHDCSTPTLRTKPRATPEPRASTVSVLDTCRSTQRSSPSSSSSSSSYKDELFWRTLQQHRQIQDLEIQLQDLEQELWERKRSSPRPPSLAPEQLEELELELELTAEWQHQLQAEVERERDMQRRLQQICGSVQHCSAEMDELQATSARLETDLHKLLHTQQNELWRPLKQELQHRRQQSEVLEASLARSQGALEAAELRLQEQRQLVEELNKELRQIQLQHFILQSSAGDVQLNNAGILD